MSYNLFARKLGDGFAADTIEEILQQVREGWDNAHAGKPYERFESAYRQEGWRMYYMLSAGPEGVEAFAKETARWPKGCPHSLRADPCQVECKAKICNFPICEA